LILSEKKLWNCETTSERPIRLQSSRWKSCRISCSCRIRSDATSRGR